MSSFKILLPMSIVVIVVAAVSEYSDYTTTATEATSQQVSAENSEELSEEEYTFQPCPKSDGSQAYDVQTGTCYDIDIGSSGPCGWRAVFVPIENNPVFGHCICENVTDCVRPLTYWHQDRERSCFELFTKGPCVDNEWLVPVRNLTTTCVPDICRPYNVANRKSTSFSVNGHCLFTETQAHCPAGKIARFLDGGLIPTCDDEHSQRCNISKKATDPLT